MDQNQYDSTAKYYDYIVPYRNRDDIEFFVDMAKDVGGTVLELGCGTGRVLIPTASEGIDIVGVDLSSQMLAVCQNNIKKEPEKVQQRIKLVEASMCNFHLEQKFDLITLPFRPFQHLLTTEEQFSCLECIKKHLAMDGKCIIDVFNPLLEALIEYGEDELDSQCTMPDGVELTRYSKVVSQNLLEQTREIEATHYLKYLDGKEQKIVQRFSMRYFFRYELEHLLIRAGFQIENIYGDYQKTPYGSLYPGELIFVISKEN